MTDFAKLRIYGKEPRDSFPSKVFLSNSLITSSTMALISALFAVPLGPFAAGFESDNA